MSWWGKLAGGAFGFLLGGPLGAMLGAALGHQFDKGMRGIRQIEGDADLTERTQAAFFAASFAVMGYVAKADGRVSESEIARARQVMGQMQLDEAQRDAAIKLFNAGKAPDFDLAGTIAQFRTECHRRVNLVRFFLEIQIMTALADGELHAGERAALLDIADRLGISRRYFEQLLNVAAGFDPGAGGSAKTPSRRTLDEAYTLLGVERGDDDAAIKRAYRRLMNQHHPDKLVSRGMPEEMVELANRKSQEIRQAYDLVRESRRTDQAA